MAQNIVEIVTIVAVALISIIFAVYLMILKKNGWLGGNSDFYRCPNQECKKIFQKPIELKDLSETPARIYPACPECGADLDLFFGSNTKKMLKMRKKTLIHSSKPEIKSIEKKEMEIVEAPIQHHGPVSMLREKVPVATPEIKSIEKKEMEIVEAPIQHHGPVSMLKKKASALKSITGRKKEDETDDYECPYYFSYLASREKQEEIPDICLECPKSLDCMLSNYKSEDSVVEISKWYQVTT